MSDRLAKVLERWEPVIGLEVHAQLLTDSKLFCGCSTRFGAEANDHTCPVCLGHPGVLPVLNRKVVDFAITLGLALGCEIRERSVWARKNYFYPDLPKGYQISQYELPICEEGRHHFELDDGTRMSARIERIHMEEDAGKNTHAAGGGGSLVDLNRASVPLLEIVSGPDLRSAEEAAAYLKALRAILRTLGVCDGNMEEGSMRCDANVSIRPRGAEAFGTRAEIKNVNSFRFVQKAIEHEIVRQAALLEAGEEVVQETRLYDSVKNLTRSMRSKADAHDYRYFPDPDLPPLILEAGQVEARRAELPELPMARADRVAEVYGLSAYDARVLSGDLALCQWFEACAAAYGGDPKKVSNWVQGEVMRELNERGGELEALKVTPSALAQLIRLVDQDAVSGTAAKEVFSALVNEGGEPAQVIEARGLGQVSDSDALEEAVDRVIANFPDESARYRAGEKKLTGFFMGQIMRETQGKANPKLVQQLLAKKLS